MTPQPVTAALAALDPRYVPLFDAVMRVAQPDACVRGLWLSGSIARGTADAWSDLDIVLAIAAEAFDDFRAEWRAWLERITPTVLARELPFGIGCYSVTPEWLRLDVVWERADTVEHTFHRERIAVFDRDELSARIPAPLVPAAATANAVRAVIDETLRAIGLFTVVEGRDDWILGMEGMQLLRGQLRAVFEWENGPRPAGGVKHLGARLTAEQRAAIEALPPLVPTRDSVVANTQALARLLLPQARALLESLGGEYPHDFEAATRAALERVMGASW